MSEPSTARAPLFATSLPLILASASPRRQAYLNAIGVEFTIRPSQVEEPPREAGEAPEAYAVRAARSKALDVSTRYPGSIVLAADTVVALGGHLLGKPRDKDDALQMLHRLCGRDPHRPSRTRSHQVVTGCCLARPKAGDEPGPSPFLVEFAVVTEVVMAIQPHKVLAAYAATREPMDKAGAYAIQGKGAFLVREVRGSYTNVVGLPLAEIVDVLTSCGVIAPGRG
ncbi:Maf family protein [Megalodesulfovibrio gigas]|uniref:dTTP/UTP pyrophosphatase n=1 Tax=Megalodesulfovibrio gigas (strain ATCC 19364 / DSM 1382 / NCIMB 9332 / VKM B-1759) TaxID=1121448 RepID=T2GB24_MEGG1|nr:Maf family protein [Megalodesulfovibrio gigas]AGW13331.1 putative maf protein [Megalodesulfovibrio gigas DSM 1382 = ATCC 19364]